MEVPQSKLIAAKRLCQAIAHYKSSVAVAEVTAAEVIANFTAPGNPSSVSSASAGQNALLDVETVLPQAKAPGAREPGCICVENMAPATASLVNIPPLAWTSQSVGMHYASNSGESQASDVSCPDSQLTSMGSLPFAWYDGSVDDLEMFGAGPLETDEVASTPNVSAYVPCSYSRPYNHRSQYTLVCSE